MNSKIAIIFSFIASLATADTNFNDVNAKYFIGTFFGDDFPLSIGTCNPLSIISSSGYQKATCIDEDTVYLEKFSDDTCVTVISSEEYNSTFRTGLGTPYDFNCDSDGTDSYASVEFGISGCATTSVVNMNAAVGVCTLTSSENLIAYCEEEFAELQYHISSSASDEAVCDDSTVSTVAFATLECDHILDSSGVGVYGTMTGCVLEGVCVGGSDCGDSTSGGVNTTTESESESDSDSEETTIYESDDSGEDDTSYDDSYSMVASLDITVTRIWNDRSDVWAILKRSYRYILANYGDYIEDNVHLFINEWSVTVLETDDDDSTARRRRLVDGDDDDDEDSYVESLQFTFTITLYDDDGDTMEAWYNFVVGLASEFEVDYETNCMDVSKGYRASGFGTVTVNSASLAYYDENGDIVDSATYDNEDATVYAGNDATSVSSHVMGLICVMFVSIFVTM